ncbi:prolyl oligopeptidase family serine peptidase [Autumnicola musiva]|uniref:Prolyl oligopeptidase family serine peptidase n=1 Tax=Autumnicola musiva TaxID=3075589 RepID=A0ABU3D911_9FLAO|nr:prolyl oligopeptidase family serine peptidase [Zunongwangia sp. F117]MDT0678025.1 prolyl oligopeptidase family serine peptidase [Zunongwangia sp. F117]
MKKFLNFTGGFIILMGLFSSPAATIAQNKEDFKREQFIRNNDTLNYRILYPKDFSEEEKYPVMLFLHGAGERGSNNESQLVHGSSLFLKEESRNRFPAIVIFPQVPKDDYWANVEVNRDSFPLQFKFKNLEAPTTSMKMAISLMDSVTQQKFVDQNRVYVGGLSMGGMGTFEILSRKPKMFASAFAICGAADPAVIDKYKEDLEIWIFHGEQDNVVPPEFSKMMAREINSSGRDAKLSLYPEDNHNSWDSALAEPYLLPWLFSKSLINKHEIEKNEE